MQGTASKRLQVRVGRGNGWTALKLTGVVDEHNALDALSDQIGTGPGGLVIDLGGIQRINSVGVRDWVRWLRRMRERFSPVVLVDCSPAIMNEVNLVRNFAEGVYIPSFRAPYYCDRCDREAVELLATEPLLAQDATRAPAFPCDKSACANALDDAVESYFAFLEDQRALPPVPNLSAAVEAARALLAGGATNLVAAPSDTGQAGQRAPLQSLARLGTEAARPAAPAEAPHATGPETPGRVDVVFVAILIGMVGVLAVLVYLITTLE